MKLLVTGTEGQVVRCLLERAQGGAALEVVVLGRPQLDLADAASLSRAVASVRPDIVVSAAAYTAVDQAEDEPDIAHRINATGPGVLAGAAAEAGIPIIHLSTDYVFSGASSEPYGEADDTDPQGVYGRTKLEGEHAVAAANPRHVILRTAWVYSPFGKNFVKTMLRLAGEREEIAVVADQWGNPTSALDIADGILHVASRLAEERSDERFGIFHLAGTGDVNWSGLAEKVMMASRVLGGPFATIRPITSAEFPTKARRPANSRLSTDKLEQAYGWRAPFWERSTEHVVARLLGAAPAVPNTNAAFLRGR
ncbi:dTDP-4-dehydrorhamnose reductase [Aquamicrobium sp. LC103]|uniref:dTDP-4-dehydrorhamnose reductase n=1 Tax=Aquamicrobium sp. LC103 TaxID=1120658 RepID=UPI00063EBB51|nr:dTDP-4-dehydrorhamnose reductase [Aquamicrobium sp. LC103]TKT77656.1 dTDP-4-dehydrorhamnose reductase [Aquamicrobium sp. LC103]